MCENYHGANYELAKAEADKVDEKIIENNRAKAEADKKFAELEAKDIIESGSGVCKPTNTTRWSFGQAVECKKRIIERRLWVNRNETMKKSL